MRTYKTKGSEFYTLSENKQFLLNCLFYLFILIHDYYSTICIVFICFVCLVVIVIIR